MLFFNNTCILCTFIALKHGCLELQLIVRERWYMGFPLYLINRDLSDKCVSIDEETSVATLRNDIRFERGKRSRAWLKTLMTLIASLFSNSMENMMNFLVTCNFKIVLTWYIVCYAAMTVHAVVPSFVQMDYYKTNKSKELPDGTEDRRFCVIRIYARRHVAVEGSKKGYWVSYSQGQLTTDPSSNSLKAKVSNISNMSWNLST